MTPKMNAIARYAIAIFIVIAVVATAFCVGSFLDPDPSPATIPQDILLGFVVIVVALFGIWIIKEILPGIAKSNWIRKVVPDDRDN